jgi:hypothetical protein
MLRAVLLVGSLLAIGYFAGCGSCLSLFEPMGDYGRDDQGNVRRLDTQKNWEFHQMTVGMHVDLERAGEPAPGAMSWNMFWRYRIAAHQTTENKDKYIAYIVESRRAAGLPELDFEGELPPSKPDR